MKKFLGHLPSWAIAAVLLATMGVSEAKAAFVFQITVMIHDDTTSTTVFGPTSIVSTGPFNSAIPPASNAQTEFDVRSAFTPAGSGVLLTGLSAVSNNPGAFLGALQVNGRATVEGSSTDQYTVTIMTSETGYSSPSGTAGSINSSHSNTVANTALGGPNTTQDFSSFFSTTNTLNDTSGPSAASATLSTAPTDLGKSTSQGDGLGTNGAIPAFVTPYALTNVLTFTIQGNGTDTDTQATNQFTATTLVGAAVIPEPTSVVLFLTGMPLPLVVLGLLRRRRRGA